MKIIEATDGTRLAVYDFNPCGKEAVVLLHGWPLSHKMYEYQIGRLLKCGYRVVALDLRGFGASDTPDRVYSFNQMATDLHSVVLCLGLRCFTLVGFSMGGAIALRYMRLFRGQGVKKLILLAAAPLLDAAARLSLWPDPRSGQRPHPSGFHRPSPAGS